MRLGWRLLAELLALCARVLRAIGHGDHDNCARLHFHDDASLTHC